MGLFRRKTGRAGDPRPAISAFWSWWATHRADVLKAHDEHGADDVVRMLQPHIMAIDERLTWEVTSSQAKAFGLVVTCAGRNEVRGTAERWLLAAPEDPDVEFFSSRRRAPELLESAIMKVDDYDFAMREVVIGARADRSRGRVDVVVHHPLFTLVDHDHRLHVAFVGLDTAMGEDGVQRWIGAVEVSVDAPMDPIPLASLGDVASQLAPTGAGEWAAMEGHGPRGPIFAIVRRAMSRHTRPLADTHVAVVLGYEAAANGMPADPSISGDIEDLEAHVLEAFGGDGPRAVHIGHVTGGGQVIAHFYIDGLELDPDVARPALNKWVRGKATMATAHDPAWEHVAPFMG